MGLKMKTKILLFISLSLLTLAGCAAENSAESYQPVSNFNNVTSQSAQTPPIITEVVKSPFTLEQCIEIALKNNPDVVGSGFDILAAEAGKDIAAGQQWPTLGLESSYRRYLDDQRLVPPRYGNEPGVFGDDIVTGDVVLRMPIFTAGRIQNEIKAADLLWQSASHRLARTREQLVFNVSQVFYNILAQKHIIKSLDFSKKVLEEHHKRVTDLISVQKAANVDLLRTEVRLADLEQRLVAENNRMSILSRVLANFLGISSSSSTVAIKGDLQLTAVAPDLSESIAQAYAKRSDYLSAKNEVEAQSKRLDVARVGHWPIVSVEGSYGLRNAADPTSHPAGTDVTEDTGFVGVRAEIPIFEGGSINARIRQERAKLRSLQERLRKLELQIHLDVETAVLNITSSQERVQATEKSIEQAKESLRIEREKYNLGKGSITDVLDAQSALLDAQTTYYHALSDYNSAVAQWRLAIGEEK